MIAVIAGATGLVGSTLLKKLLADTAFSEVIALSRNPLILDHPKLKTVLLENIDNIELISDELKGDAYFCCLGSTIKKAGNKQNFKKIDHDAIINFARVAKLHGAKSFILISASGANAHSPIFYNQIKGQTEEALKAMSLNSLTIFRPGLLLGERSEKRFGEHLAIKILKKISPLIPETLERSMATPIENLAGHMLTSAKDHHTNFNIIEAKNI